MLGRDGKKPRISCGVAMGGRQNGEWGAHATDGASLAVIWVGFHVGAVAAVVVAAVASATEVVGSENPAAIFDGVVSAFDERGRFVVGG